jgi:hypothetical protein
MKVPAVLRGAANVVAGRVLFTAVLDCVEFACVKLQCVVMFLV